MATSSSVLQPVRASAPFCARCSKLPRARGTRQRPSLEVTIASSTATRPGRTRRKTSTKSVGARRITALDTVRGLAIAATVVGLAAGDLGQLPDLFHPAPVRGFRPPDLVAPTLLFVSGAALATSRVRHSQTRAATLRLARRVAVLAAAALALFLLEGGGSQSFTVEVAMTSPLVRIALAWVIVWQLAAWPRPAQVTIATVLLAVNWFAIGRFAAGDLVPFVALPTVVVLVLGGYWLGDWWRSRPDGPATASAIALTGLYVGAAGVLTGQLLPLSRNLMTVSFVLFAAGATLLLLALAHVLVTVLPGERVASRVTILGRHAFVAYFSVAASTAWLGAGHPGSPWERALDGFRATFGAELGTLLLALAVLGVMSIVTTSLDRRGFHVRP